MVPDTRLRRREMEETMNFEGSDLERQAILYCKRQLIHILDQSYRLKVHGPKGKKRK